MPTYNEKSEDVFGRQLKPVLFNTAKDGSGTWYFPVVDSDGRLSGLAPTKTIETDLLAIQAIAENVVLLSTELDVSAKKKVAIYIFHAKNHASASVGQGTAYSIEVNPYATGNDGWTKLDSFVAAMTAPTVATIDNTEAIGQTVIECGATVPAVGDIVFFYNSVTPANSEWREVVARDVTGGSESFTIKDALTYAHAAGTYYTQGEKYVMAYDVRPFKRLRVVANNAGGTTNRAVVAQVKCTTSY